MPISLSTKIALFVWRAPPSCRTIPTTSASAFAGTRDDQDIDLDLADGAHARGVQNQFAPTDSANKVLLEEQYVQQLAKVVVQRRRLKVHVCIGGNDGSRANVWIGRCVGLQGSNHRPNVWIGRHFGSEGSSSDTWIGWLVSLACSHCHHQCRLTTDNVATGAGQIETS